MRPTTSTPSVRLFRARAALEVVILVAAWQVYKLGRYLVRDQPGEALANAHDVLGLESEVALDIEPGLQDLVLESETLVEILNRYYVYAHVGVTILCLIWLYGWHPHIYRPTRRVLVIATSIGLAVHGLYPLAPPRFVPHLGMVDTLARYGPEIYSRDRFGSVTNQFAAMPSFHVGWAVLFAWAVIAAGRTRWRWLILAHPLLMVVSVMATANHYLLDAVVGSSLIGSVMAFDRWWQTRKAPPTVENDLPAVCAPDGPRLIRV